MTGELASTGDVLLHRLTPKERECLRLVAAHLSSKEIALRLGISKTSVDTYCDRAREKLGVPGRYEAARLLAAALADPASPPIAAGEIALAPRPASAGAAPHGLRRRLLLTLLVVVMAPVALATLLAGLRALREVVPDPHEPASVQATSPPRHSG